MASCYARNGIAALHLLDCDGCTLTALSVTDKYFGHQHGEKIISSNLKKNSNQDVLVNN